MKHASIKALVAALILLSSLVALADGPDVGAQGPSVVLTDIQPNGSELKDSVVTRYGNTKYTFIEFSSITCGYCDINLPVYAKLAQGSAATTTSRLVEIDRDEAGIRAYITAHKKICRSRWRLIPAAKP